MKTPNIPAEIILGGFFVNKVQFSVLMPIICADLLKLIIQKENTSHKEAFERLYSSKLYALLEDEETKVWYYSTPMLYSLLLEEEQTGKITFSDVQGD